MGSVQRVSSTHYVYTNFDPLYLINDQKIAFYQTSAVLNLPKPVNSNSNVDTPTAYSFQNPPNVTAERLNQNDPYRRENENY